MRDVSKEEASPRTTSSVPSRGSQPDATNASNHLPNEKSVVTADCRQRKLCAIWAKRYHLHYLVLRRFVEVVSANHAQDHRALVNDNSS
jgi:hypothetical protein